MRREKLYPDQYYHIYNRGVNHNNIFFQDENWSFFLLRYRKYCIPDIARTVAYCLMPNHYHLLILISGDGFSKKVMQPFTVSFTKAINKKQNRVGSLFQGPFRSKRVDNINYLDHLTRYIHLNPVTAGYVNSPAEWLYSSYQDYIGLREGTLPYKKAVMENFSSIEEYRHFVEDVQDENQISHLTFD